MEGIVLAGGFGTRLREMVPDLPKPMAPVAGRPFLEILLSSLARKGFHRVILSLGYMANKVVAHFGESYAGIELVYQIEPAPLGTGGALRLAMSQCQGDHVFVFNGDTFLDLEVQDLELLWQKQRTPIVVAREVPDTSRYGRLATDSERLRMIGFAEKGATGPGLINAGCYVFPIDLLRDFQPDVPFSLESDFLTQAATKRRFDLFVTHGHFIDIGVPEDYIRAQSELAGESSSTLKPAS